MSSPSPSSSSSDPDYQVATSDLDDDSATAVHQSHADAATVVLPKRPDAEGFLSFLLTPDDVVAVCKKYGVPEDHYTARLAGDLRACSPPQKRVFAPPQKRVFAATERSDVVASSYVAILQAANYVSFSLDYALELEEKLLARDAEIAALRKQLGETKGELAQAKVPRR